MQNYALFIEMIREMDQWKTKEIVFKPLNPEEERVGSNGDSENSNERGNNEVNSPEDPYEEPTEEFETHARAPPG